jgi:hypothetical protein
LNRAAQTPALTRPLALQALFDDTTNMDSGEAVFVFSRLVIGALAAFFAIMLWSRTRDTAWMLMIGGTIAAYGESLYTVLNLFGISTPLPAIGSLPVPAIILSNVPMLFYISAFLVMVTRSYGYR